MRKKTLIRQLAVSVSEPTWQKILEITDRQESTISAWIREAIEKQLSLNKKGDQK